MCAHSPYWPTPEEAQRLRAAHPDKVTYDTSYYCDGWVRVMRPAAVGEIPGETYRGYAGACVFFQGERCALHYTDLKPLEGRLASHEHSAEQRDELRMYIGRMWRTE
jgi:hypothetical protein